MLQSLSIRYDQVEDRMVLHLHVKQEAGPTTVHVLQVTRRVCAGWRGDLQAMVDISAQAPARLDPASKAAVSKAHHEAMSSQATVRTEPALPQSAPEHGPALLVTKIACGRRRADGRWVIRFETQSQPPLGLVLSSQTLHALVDALSRRVQTAQWALGQVATEQVATPAVMVAKQMH